MVKFYRGECLGSPHTGYGGAYLTLIDFLVRHFENQQAQILAGALHIAQRATEARSAKLKKQPFRIIYCKPILRALSLLVCSI